MTDESQLVGYYTYYIGSFAHTDATTSRLRGVGSIVPIYPNIAISIPMPINTYSYDL